MSIYLNPASSLLRDFSEEPGPTLTQQLGTSVALNNGRYRLEPSYHPQFAGLFATDRNGATDGTSFQTEVRGQDPKSIDAELAQIAKAVSDPRTTRVGDWTRLDDAQLIAAGIDPASLENPETGFRAGIYTDGEGHYVLAYAGSNDLQDWLNNARQGVGLDAEQYDEAVQLAQQADAAFGEDLVITGHSLGGGLAATAALATDNAAVTFNAAGVSDDTIRGLGLDPKTAKADAEAGLIRRYAIDGEILTTEQEEDLIVSALLPDALGHKITLSDPDPLSFWERLNPYTVIVGHPTDLHMIDSVIDALENDRPWEPANGGGSW